MEITVIFGSNTGQKRQLIEEAIRRLVGTAGPVLKASSYYETEPWGFSCAETFLTRVVVFNSRLDPENFLTKALEIEKQLGRVRHSGQQYESRTIDIDILFCDSLLIHTPELIVPHPRLAERNFVLVPLNEIMPHFEHPLLHRKISELLIQSPDKLSVKKIEM